MNLLKLTILVCLCSQVHAQKSFQLMSPSGNNVIHIQAGRELKWQVEHNSQAILDSSALSMKLQSGEVLGNDVVILSSEQRRMNETFNAYNYKKDQIVNQCNELVLNCKGDYGVIFRAYNDGVAYRFFTKKKGEIIIQSEQVDLNFNKDYKILIPYLQDLRNHDRFSCAFEALYEDINISGFAKDTLAFLPFLVDYGNSIKAVISEADLEDYPGLLITDNKKNRQGLTGVSAPYPVEEKQHGINYLVSKRADYIAKTNGARSFPWRFIIVSDEDKELANTDMVQRLAAPSRIEDVSWIKPGKVAWDWWNDWNISHVDFRAGINTETYKYYIDFASANKLEYIILDEGWSEKDITKVKPVVDLQALIDYGKQKNVGIILWAGWYAILQHLDEALDKYSAMGVKGFKIDFLDRDDQKTVASVYEIAKKAAAKHLLVDYHGMYKPTGVQRTYPNIVNFEGVRGMENVKWAPSDNVPLYDVTLPFIRMAAGPLDYTPGAMRNATQSGFKPNYSLPMSQGTRCHQMAMYTIFDAPLQMLADNPTAYMKEQVCTDFIAKVPTVFNQTIVLDAKVGSYITIAKKKDNVWFVGAMTNWNPRDLTIDLSFLGEGNYEAEIFKDGINADRDATDYKREVISVSAKDKLNARLMNGGGWTARIYKKS
ncbi:glycoside hydrolase family 97 protein [Chitinophagaceae bacterium LWZ2-11]